MTTSGLPQIFTVDQLADHYGISPDTLYDLLKSGEIVGFKIGMGWRVRLEDWSRFLEQRAQRRADEIASWDVP